MAESAGWTGTGSVPASGSATAVSFAVTNDSSLVWNWRTDYRIAVAVSGPATADFSEDWVESGRTKIVRWTPSVPYFATTLSGDTTGVTLNEAAGTLTIPANRARSISLAVRELTLENVLDDDALAWTTDAAAPWFPQIGTSADGEDAAQSGSAAGDDASGLETVLQGAGTLSWSWKVSTDDNCGVDVFLDGEWVPDLAPGTVWSEASLDVSGSGRHVVRFEFWNMGSTADAKGWIDRVSWTGDAPFGARLRLVSTAQTEASLSVVSFTGNDPEPVHRTLEVATDEAFGAIVKRVALADVTEKTVETVSVTGLSPETAYWARLRASRSSGGESVSETVSFATPAHVAPVLGTPTAEAWQRDAAVTVPLEALGSDGGAVTMTATATKVVGTGAPVSLSRTLVAAGSARFDLTGLSPGCVYRFVVVARAAATGLENSVSGGFTTPEHVPPTVRIASVEPGATSVGAVVRVDSIGDRYAASARATLQLSDNPGDFGNARTVSPDSAWTEAGEKSARFTGLVRNTAYYLRAIVVNEPVGLCTTSAVVSVRTAWGETPRIAGGGSGPDEMPALSFLPSETGEGTDFVIRIDNPVPGCYYVVYTNGTPSGPFAVQSCVVPESSTGGYIIRVPADEETLFVKIGISEVRVEPGTREIVDPFAIALDGMSQAFSTGGNAEWFVQGEETFEGTSALRSGAIGHNQNSWIETTVTGPGTISFWWKVSSESNGDCLRFHVDGLEQASVSGTGGGWVRQSFAVTGPGEHVLRWSYLKNSSGTAGSDCAWLDSMTWTPPRGFYTVRFLPNGGTGTMDEQTLSLDNAETLSPNAFSREGFVFAGWSDSPSGTVLWSDEASVTNLADENGGIVCLYAIWSDRIPGLSIAYYDVAGSSSSFSSHSSMTSFFASRTPTLQGSTADFGDTLDSAITGMTSSDVSRISGKGFRNFFSTTGTSNGRFHGKFANSSQNSFCGRASGSISIAAAGTYSFGLAGDDGAVLFLDGTKVCSASWGSEGTGTISLTAGTHSIDVAFYEGSGGQGFLVQWKRPGDSVWSPLPQSVLWH